MSTYKISIFNQFEVVHSEELKGTLDEASALKDSLFSLWRDKQRRVTGAEVEEIKTKETV